jgi:hypothetical protein
MQHSPPQHSPRQQSLSVLHAPSSPTLHCPLQQTSLLSRQQISPQHARPGQLPGKQGHPGSVRPAHPPGPQPSQEKQQVPPQQTSLPSTVREQQWMLSVHPLPPAGRRQVPRQHPCPAQQSVSALHALPKGALHCPEQHCRPLGQLVALQAHCCWLLQTVPLGQVTHWAPPEPQTSLLVPGTQTPGLPGPLAQQPSGQLCASQTHRPALQPWPAGHEPQLPPQPSGPHALPAQSGVQHAWSWQTWPEPQVTQRAPFVPQDSALVPARQTPAFPGPASQQPVGQLSPVQTHWPFWHTSPPWLQSTQNAPSMPHVSRAVPGRHVPPMQQPEQFCGVQQGAAQKLFPV